MGHCAMDEEDMGSPRHPVPRRHRTWSYPDRVRLSAALLLLLLVAPATASASFPGANGLLMFGSYRLGQWDCYTMHQDGSDQRRLTTNPAGDYCSQYSPD